ncbi:hypothetical protein JX266_011832 [Neoarthrinium moseri]|uniref:uncharacterized protein n=1 Tax=Neoarthrinium moseri TaxID=1658444 RepID=UPI001FDB3FE1|nr:uncharacterized protein JN550_006051 [Neoarthrinium moseri]KAI1841972.1 hypothetical protein JX266_011832 [Neoarthrinium moseri]KAI1869064.1 hypothetical protein JN550_006051 [Neoarthrinium moseri]
MSTSSSTKRPRLSLQTKTATVPSTRTRNALARSDPKSPTTFNTLSNVYVTAIERSTPVQSTPVQSTPLTAINLFQSLKLQTNPEALRGQQRTQTPYTATYPDTPLSANPKSPMQVEINFPSTMTATPPLSAGPTEQIGAKVFSFAPKDTLSHVIPASPAQSRRSIGASLRAPYSHPRSLHSILRNSPLPPSSAKSPISPRRQSLRLQEKAARRVGYESPLTQTITTEKYTRSHIDLLSEDASPYSATPTAEDSDMVLDLTMAYSRAETRDGGQTPGPFEEMRRRMAGLQSETPITSPRPGGIRKKKREKKRKWVWTIGQDGEESESGALLALKAAAEASTPRTSVPIKAATPEPVTAVQTSVEPVDSEVETQDVEMSDVSSIPSSSRGTTPFSVEIDPKTPVMTAAAGSAPQTDRLGSVDLINPETGSRRDTPIPPDLVTR